MSIFLLAAAVAAGAPAVPVTPSRGYEAEMNGAGLLCLRPTTPAESTRLAIPVNNRECRSITHWQVEGLEINRVARH